MQQHQLQICNNNAEKVVGNFIFLDITKDTLVNRASKREDKKKCFFSGRITKVRDPPPPPRLYRFIFFNCSFLFFLIFSYNTFFSFLFLTLCIF